MLQKYIISLFIFFISLQLNAEKITIGIFSSLNVKDVKIELIQGEYIVLTDDGQEVSLSSKSKESLTIESLGKKIKLKINQKVKGNFSEIIIKPHPESNGILKLTPNQNASQKREYEGEINIAAIGANSLLQLKNRVDFEHYLAGVVQSEIYGRPDQGDVFKVQSIISRTWALKNWEKHLSEGYNLCDKVHCQVYHNRCLREDIIQATQETCGEVVVDSNDNLIETPYHSNSGGQTVNSEDIWSQNIPYLRSVVDTFSPVMKMGCWEKKIGKKEWIQYFKKNHKVDVENDSILKRLLNFQQMERCTKINNVPLKLIRQDFGLRSTFFDVIEEEDFVHIKGKGYGHGVGLSQEGAIRMVELGFTYDQILPFYYKDCKLKKEGCDLVFQKNISDHIPKDNQLEKKNISEKITNDINEGVVQKNQSEIKTKESDKKMILEPKKKPKAVNAKEKDYDFEIILE